MGQVTLPSLQKSNLCNLFLFASIFASDYNCKLLVTNDYSILMPTTPPVLCSELDLYRMYLFVSLYSYTMV